MNEIIETTLIAEQIYRIIFINPELARKRKPGQFLILRVHDNGERVPLTMVNSDITKGTVEIIVQAVGHTTRELCDLKVGEAILDVAGPLGMPTHIEKVGTCVMIGGGVGIAPLFPITRGFKEADNKIITILGARNQNLIILEKEMLEISDELLVMTDDGSRGKQGLVTNALQSLIDRGETIKLVMAVGPVIMMKFVAELTRKYNIHTMVSLNPIMVDGTGMCGGCRVLINGQSKFACVHGPEFDGHAVDYGQLMQRLKMYKHEEKCLLDKYMLNKI